MASKSKRHTSRGSSKEKRRKSKKETKEPKEVKKSFKQSIRERFQRRTKKEPELVAINDSESMASADMKASAAELDKMMMFIPPNSRLSTPVTPAKLPSAQAPRVRDPAAMKAKKTPPPMPTMRKAPKTRKGSKSKDKADLPLQHMKKVNEKGKKKKQVKEKPREKRPKSVKADPESAYRKYQKKQADPELAYKKYQKKAEVAKKKKKKKAPKQPERRDFRSFSDSSDYSESDYESRYHSDDDYSAYSDSRYDSYSDSGSDSEYSSHSSDSSGSYSTDETDEATLVTKRAAWERNPEEDNSRVRSHPKSRRKKHLSGHISSPRKRKDNSNHISSPRRISNVRSSHPRNSSDRIRGPQRSKKAHDRYYRDGEEDYSDGSSYYSDSSFYSSDSDASNTSESSYSDSGSESNNDYYATSYDDDTRNLPDSTQSASWTEGPRTLVTYGSGETEPTRAREYPTLLKDMSGESVDEGRSMTVVDFRDSSDNVSTEADVKKEVEREREAAQEIERDLQAAKNAVSDPQKKSVFSWILGGATNAEPNEPNNDSVIRPLIDEMDEQEEEDETVFSSSVLHSPRASRSQGLIHSPRSESSSRNDYVIRNRRSINYSQDAGEEEPGSIYPTTSTACSATVDQIIVADSMPDSMGDTTFLAPIDDHSESSSDMSTFNGDATTFTQEEKKIYQSMAPVNHSIEDNQDSTVDDSCYRGEKMELASYHSDLNSSAQEGDETNSTKRVKAEILDDYDVSEILHGKRPFKSQTDKAKKTISMSNSLTASERRELRIKTMKAHRDFIYQNRSIDSNPSAAKDTTKSVDGYVISNAESIAKEAAKSVDGISAGASVLSNSIAQDDASAPNLGAPDALIDIVRNAFPFIMLSSGNAAATLETPQEEREEEEEDFDDEETTDEDSNESETVADTNDAPTSPGAIEDVLEAAFRFFAPKEESSPLITEEKNNQDESLRCTNFNPNPTKVAVAEDTSPSKIPTTEEEETNSVIAESANVSSLVDAASSIADSNLSDVAVNHARRKNECAPFDGTPDASRFNADGIPLQLRPKKIWRAFDSGYSITQSVVSTGASVETGNDSSGSSTEPKSNRQRDNKDVEGNDDNVNNVDNDDKDNTNDNNDEKDELVLKELVLSEIDEEDREDAIVTETETTKEEEKEKEQQAYQIEEIEEIEEPPMPLVEVRERPKPRIDTTINTGEASNSAGARLSPSPRYRRRSEMIKMKARQQQQRERFTKVENVGGYVVGRGERALEPSPRRHSAASSQKQRVKQRSHKQCQHQEPQYSGRSNNADRPRTAPFPTTHLVKNSMKQGRRSKFERERAVMNQHQHHPQQFHPATKPNISKNKHQHQHQQEPWPLTNHTAARATGGMERRDDSFSEFHDAIAYGDEHHQHQHQYQHQQSMSSGSHNEVFRVISSRRGRGMHQETMMDEREDPRIMSLDYALD